ncbi:MAG: DUF2235 domain-containing protein [Saprospiraceae bacterium]|nr:DUF2235 domain-containing protein [Saprospiraceae bacterium]
MPKNIIICCDGTNNKVSLYKNTNVVHLYSCLEKSKDQITYYNPGVGTLAPTTFKRKFRRALFEFSDKILAKTLNDRVKDAYIFLMNHYEQGDKIYLFGFSRGAYTVRMLAGIIKLYGLLHPGNTSHLEYIFHDYLIQKAKLSLSERRRLFGIANRLKHSFSFQPDIHFMGIWDTVVSIGNFVSLFRPFPYTESLKNVKTVRHALAIDERRKHYQPYRVNLNHNDCKEVWFAGTHSDVGGSYEQEGLSKIALEWMLGEASNFGLKLDKNKVDRYVYGKNSKYQKPDFKQNINKSDTFLYNLTNLFPRSSFDPVKGHYWDFRVSAPRNIEKDAIIHESVLNKMNYKTTGHCYEPQNIDLGSNNYKWIQSLHIV